MHRDSIAGWLTGLPLAALALLVLAWWFALEPDENLALREAADPVRPAAPRTRSAVDLKGWFQRLNGEPSGAPGAWPRFRGAHGDNISAEEIRLADRWPAEGPPVLWTRQLGEGHAGAAVYGGCVYVLDHDERLHQDVLRSFCLETGQEIWRRGYRVQIKRNHGITRTVPAVNEDAVVSLGPKGHVLCVDRVSGAFRWGIDMVRDWGAETPLWYTGQCPLIDGRTAVLAPAGSNLLAGVDLLTGDVQWTTPNPRGWKMSHSSVQIVTALGRRMYVYSAVGGAAGVSAEASDRGALLWECAEWDRPIVAPSAVGLDGERILLTAGYGSGSMVVRLIPEGDRMRAVPEREWDRTVFASEQQTPILYRGHLFSILPKDAGALREQLVCFDPRGILRWSSGRTDRYGLGPYLIGDGKLFVLNDDGTLSLVRACEERYELLSRVQVLDGRDAWAPMALAGGRLLLRDDTRMVCLDVSAR